MLTGQQLEKRVTVEVDGNVVLVASLTEALVFAKAIVEAVERNRFNDTRVHGVLRADTFNMTVTIEGSAFTETEFMAADNDGGFITVSTCQED